jgi:hypothetical protein
MSTPPLPVARGGNLIEEIGRIAFNEESRTENEDEVAQRCNAGESVSIDNAETVKNESNLN